LVAFSWDYCLNFEGVEDFTFFPFLTHTSSFYLTHSILLPLFLLKGDTPPHSSSRIRMPILVSVGKILIFCIYFKMDNVVEIPGYLSF
jgi:hypothetical protein